MTTDSHLLGHIVTWLTRWADAKNGGGITANLLNAFVHKDNQQLIGLLVSGLNLKKLGVFSCIGVLCPVWFPAKYSYLYPTRHYGWTLDQKPLLTIEEVLDYATYMLNKHKTGGIKDGKPEHWTITQFADVAGLVLDEPPKNYTGSCWWCIDTPTKKPHK